MYHQFKELADVDITKGPMEVGPTCHYMMAAFVWTPKRRKPRCPVSSLPVKLPQVFTVESPRRKFALRFARLWPPRRTICGRICQRASPASIDSVQIEQAEKELLAPFSNAGAESPYAVHRDLQEVMQNLVGIIVQKRTWKGRSSNWKAESPCGKGRRGRLPSLQSRLAPLL